jgi:hypothetical protein
MTIWVVRFVTELERLGPWADPAILADRGAELWETLASRKPEDAALDELALSPPVTDTLQ